MCNCIICTGEYVVKKCYNDGVTKEEMMTDGWSRGFQPCQTIAEAKASGITLTVDEVLAHWKIWDDDYEADCDRDTQEGTANVAG